jgi:hypothetical protein
MRPAPRYRATLIVLLALVAPLLAVAQARCAEGAEAASGRWRERSELVWDGAARVMVRRTFVAWDPHPHLDLDFLWKGADGSAERAGVISGDGRLLWLAKGAASYDARAVFSDYRGEMRNGRPDGSGRLKLSSGEAYDGEWRDGVMSGKGTLRLASGDEYSGTFADNLPEGTGRYAAVDGTVFEGPFSKGVREGSGVLTLPDGRAFRSEWHQGREIGRSPLEAKPVQLAQAGDVDVNVYIDQKMNQAFKDGDQEMPSYAYAADATSGEVRIGLDSPEIVGLWKGDATIRADSDEWSPSLFEDPGQFAPLFLVVQTSNQGSRAAQIDSAYFELEQSETDLEPYVVILGPGGPDSAQAYYPGFTLDNYGWGSVENATLTYAFGDKSGPVTRTTSVSIGDFDQVGQGTVADGLSEMGVNVAKLEHSKFRCLSDDLESCAASWSHSDILGEVAQATFTRYAHVMTRVWGTLEYDWTDVAGASQHRSSPVTIDIPLIYVGPEAEYGAAGPVERGYPTIKLPLDRTNLRIPINYRAQLAPGEVKRAALNLVAEKSSHHRFRFVFALADGSTVASPTIDLSYFIPRALTYD